MNTDGYQTSEAAAQFIVTHTSGGEIVTDEYTSWEDARGRAAEVYRRGDWPVTIDSTQDASRWIYNTSGELAPAPALGA